MNLWVHRVRGLMTFGSPIDKHLILWPELFASTQKPTDWPAEAAIEWRNYYDRGDPIGFALDDARKWLKHHELLEVFHFKDKHDFGFTRYPFPGKAHVDYWQDEAVFGHFIDTVVNHEQSERKATRKQKAPPGDIRWKKWLSYGLPYLGILVLLFGGIYVLFKAITAFTAPEGYRNDGMVFRNVANLTLLVTGLTVATRLPRLTKSWGWRMGGLATFAFLAWVCCRYLSVETGSEQVLRTWVGHHTSLSLDQGQLRVLIALLVMGLTWTTSIIKPSWGLAPLLSLGTLAMLGFVGYHFAMRESTEQAPLWPVFPAAAAFFYIWWLAALLFDLVFVWHVHIRQELALAHMEEAVGWEVRNNATDGTGTDSPVPEKQPEPTLELAAVANGS